MFKVEVDPKKCTGCSECVDICPEEVFELQNEKAVPIKQEECLGCALCIDACEQGAITVTGDD